MTDRPAVFLDRDGVLTELIPDPHTGVRESALRVQDVRLFDGVAADLQILRDAGYLLVCVTNQPAAAKATVSVEDLEAIHHRTLELLSDGGVTLDASYMCLHHPDGVVPDLSGPCDCRKPAPGMLLQAARELPIALTASWMVGDTDADVQAGQAAGCRTVLVTEPASAHKRFGAVTPDVTVANLHEAVPLLVESAARTH